MKIISNIWTNIWIKRLLLIIVSLFALIGLAVTLLALSVLFHKYDRYDKRQTPYERLFLNTEMINQVDTNQSVDIPATKLLPEKVKYVCSIGPYFDEFFLELSDDERSKVMLHQVSILFPIEEGKGAFVYFDDTKTLIQYDKLFMNHSKYRWSRTLDLSESDREAYKTVGNSCIESKDLVFQVTSQEDFYKIALKPIDNKQPQQIQQNKN